VPHIMLCDHQALAVSWAGYELVEELSARQVDNWSQPPKVDKDAYNSKRKEAAEI
jgi:hypothetical protein